MKSGAKESSHWPEKHAKRSGRSTRAIGSLAMIHRIPTFFMRAHWEFSKAAIVERLRWTRVSTSWRWPLAQNQKVRKRSNCDSVRSASDAGGVVIGWDVLGTSCEFLRERGCDGGERTSACPRKKREPDARAPRRTSDRQLDLRRRLRRGRWQKTYVPQHFFRGASARHPANTFRLPPPRHFTPRFPRCGREGWPSLAAASSPQRARTPRARATCRRALLLRFGAGSSGEQGG